jgi:glycosyltransferase involved in cell wall biosynthesis/GT2 family glycosyltransferase
VVLTYGTGAEHEPLLASLLVEGMAPERILIVHNPAAPGEPDPTLPPGCELLRASHNLGYAGGMNLGIERQLDRGCELLLLLTHDARLREGALAALIGAAEAQPEYGALGPALVFAGSEDPFSFGGITRANGTMAHRSKRPSETSGIATCDWIDGGTMLIRAGALAQTGGFDERFWSYCEEAELCLRISRAGFRVGVLLDAVADQSPGGPKRPGPWAYLLTRNGTAYAHRAVGLRGLAFLNGRAALSVAWELTRALSRALHLRPGPAGDPWAVAVGISRGTLDFYRRRWGPPPRLPGAGDVGNLEAPASAPAPVEDTERPRVLQLGPDVRGGMRAVMHGLFASPLGERYRLEFVATHRGTGPLERLAVYCLGLWRLTWWSLRGRGRIVHVHATVRGSMLRKAFCVLLAKALRRRAILHMHSGPGDVVFERTKLGPLRVALFRRMFRRADVVLAVSAASGAALEETYGARDVVVVPNPAPEVPAVPLEANGPPTALYVGGFANRVKGGEELIAALAQPALAELDATLAGPGELPPAGRELLADRPRLEWRGWLGEEEREEALRAAAIFVLPSTSEGLPMALLEAMAWGRAIVATAVGGVPDVLTDGSDALIVPPGEPEALAAALARLAGDADLCQRLGPAARERARRLNAEEVTDRLDRIYTDLLA